MPRHRKASRRDANAATIQRYFDRAMELRAGQKAKGREISALNVKMQDDAVDPGVLSLFCRIASMPDAKAALYLTLMDYYKQALANRLPNPTTQQREAGETVAPFGARPAA